MVVKQEYKNITGVSAGIIFLFDRKQDPIEINQSLISFNNYWIWKYLIWMDIKFNLCISERLWGNPPLTDGFSLRKVSNAESISMSWRFRVWK